MRGTSRRVRETLAKSSPETDFVQLGYILLNVTRLAFSRWKNVAGNTRRRRDAERQGRKGIDIRTTEDILAKEDTFAGLVT